MGISFLTKHLLPYAERARLGGGGTRTEELPCVSSVVIDGPSLVYHVYYRLLAWMDPSCDVLDIQPTCDEVSRGVVSYLLQLSKAGVVTHGIYFDGALPVSKRETRLARIEKSRHRLEVSRRRTPSPSSPEYREAASIQPGQLWQTRSLPSRWKGLPENPFMVSAVYEDLRERWTNERISTDVQTERDHLPVDAEYPWASITAMVSGEADLTCAHVAKLTGSAVLTSDSDLLLHDLGPHGSVVFLDSLQLSDSLQRPFEPEIQGLRICPHSLPHRLGGISLLRFAYELKRTPWVQFPELVRRSKAEFEPAKSSDYQDFIQEYQPSTELSPMPKKQLHPLDPRVSELFWQYELPGVYGYAEQPHIYLGILNEDHSRRCAWEHGRFYRSLGYSLLNLSRPSNGFTNVYEFVRRGGRIVAETITLASLKTAMSDLQLLQRRLGLARAVFNSPSAGFWVLFALTEIYHDSSNMATTPSADQLRRFLGEGSMAKKTKWTDIHLLAQIQAVLYSLRMLRQLLGVATLDNEVLAESRLELADLPPLHTMMRSRREMIPSFVDKQLVHGSVNQLFQTYC